jgi:hypothetical protein
MHDAGTGRSLIVLVTEHQYRRLVPEQLSVALAASPTLISSLFDGQRDDVVTDEVTTGAGLDAVVLAVAELLAVLPSGVSEVTVAVFAISVPFDTLQLTVATRVMVAVVPDASEPKVRRC